MAWNLLLPLTLLNTYVETGPGTDMPESRHNIKYAAVASDFVNRLVGGQDDTYWFIWDSATLVRWDTSTGETTDVAMLTSGLVYLATYDDGKVVINTRDATTGKSWVAVHAADTGKLVWDAETAEAPPSLALSGESLWVPQPLAHTIEVRSVTAGDLQATIPLPCQPWSVSFADSTASVTCPRDNKIVRIDMSAHAVVRTDDTPSGVSQVLQWSGHEWWGMPARMKTVRADDDSVLWMTFPFAGYMTQIAAQGDTLACVGYEQVGVFTGELGSSGAIERMGTQTLTRDLLITPDGKVLYSTDNMVVLMTPK